MHGRAVSSLGGALTSPLGMGAGIVGGNVMSNGVGTLMTSQNPNVKVVN